MPFNIYTGYYVQNLKNSIINKDSYEDLSLKPGNPQLFSSNCILSNENFYKVPKSILGLKNCTSLNVAWGDGNIFSTHHNLPALFRIANYQKQISSLLKNCLQKIHNEAGEEVKILIGGGNYLTDEENVFWANELIEDARIRSKKGEISHDQFAAASTIIQAEIANAKSQNLHYREDYINSIYFIMEQVRAFFGSIDPLIAGCNSVSSSTNIIVMPNKEGVSFSIIKPEQVIPEMNDFFNFSNFEEQLRVWNKKADEFISSLK